MKFLLDHVFCGLNHQTRLQVLLHHCMVFLRNILINFSFDNDVSAVVIVIGNVRNSRKAVYESLAAGTSSSRSGNLPNLLQLTFVLKWKQLWVEFVVDGDSRRICSSKKCCTSDTVSSVLDSAEGNWCDRRRKAVKWLAGCVTIISIVALKMSTWIHFTRSCNLESFALHDKSVS